MGIDDELFPIFMIGDETEEGLDVIIGLDCEEILIIPGIDEYGCCLGCLRGC